MKKLLFICLLFCSCKAMDITGEHTVQYVRRTNTGFIMKLVGLKKEFIVKQFGDTLKKGDKIILKKRN